MALGVQRFERELVARARLFGCHLLAHAHVRQDDLLIAKVGGRVIASLDIGPQEAGEHDSLARGREYGVALFSVGGDLHAGAHVAGVGHLAGDGALPDEIVECQFLLAEVRCHVRRALDDLAGPDGLVGFLGVAGLGLVLTRPLGVFLAVNGLNDLLGIAQRLLGKVHRVGAHVGDKALALATAEIHALVELLGDLHGAAGGEAEFAVCLLLERGRW